MPAFYVHRNAEQRLRELVSGLRVVIVNGPRQSGKTTLLRMYQEQSAAAYVTLDDAFQLAQAQDDPATFAAQGARPLIIDEVQRGGDDLIRAIKMIVDGSQDRGQFVLSGSARFLTVPTLSESLAGRADLLDLRPLSLNERTGGPADFADRLFGEPSSLLASRESPWTRDAYLDLIAEGGYPEVLTISASAVRRSWYDGYLNTVIVRDIGDFASLPARTRRTQRPKSGFSPALAGGVAAGRTARWSNADSRPRRWRSGRIRFAARHLGARLLCFPTTWPTCADTDECSCHECRLARQPDIEDQRPRCHRPVRPVDPSRARPPGRANRQRPVSLAAERSVRLSQRSLDPRRHLLAAVHAVRLYVDIVFLTTTVPLAQALDIVTQTPDPDALAVNARARRPGNLLAVRRRYRRLRSRTVQVGCHASIPGRAAGRCRGGLPPGEQLDRPRRGQPIRRNLEVQANYTAFQQYRTALGRVQYCARQEEVPGNATASPGLGLPRPALHLR